MRAQPKSFSHFFSNSSREVVLWASKDQHRFLSYMCIRNPIHENFITPHILCAQLENILKNQGSFSVSRPSNRLLASYTRDWQFWKVRSQAVPAWRRWAPPGADWSAWRGVWGRRTRARGSCAWPGWAVPSGTSSRPAHLGQGRSAACWATITGASSG